MERVSVEAANARSDHSSAFGLLKWATNSEFVLRPVLPRAEIERLLHTTRYWHVASAPHTTDIIKLATDELDDAKWRWDLELAELKTEQEKWAGASAIIVADTNIFLHQPKRFDEINWYAAARLEPIISAARIVIPIIVIDELDRIEDVGNTGTGPYPRCRE